MKKLCILGGGGLNTPLLVAALSSRRDFVPGEICLFDVNEPVLREVSGFCRYLSARKGIRSEMTETVSLKEAVTGASHILNMMRVGGAEAAWLDRRWLAMSGITGHAAGYAEACRTLPLLNEYLTAVERHAPDAIFINFSNPVSIFCRAIARSTRLDFAGLCHHSILAVRDFAALLGVLPEDLRVRAFGVNHFSWVTDVLTEGVSRFDELAAAIERRKIKLYNHGFIRRHHAIPIGHAVSQYRRNGRYLAFEKGKKGNLEDIAHKFFVPKRLFLRFQAARRNRILEAYRTRDDSILDQLARSAPWYEKSIVPFLADLSAGSGRIEYLLTVKKAMNERSGEGVFEMPCEIADGRIRPRDDPSALPDFIAGAVDNIARSEDLMIEAILNNSRTAAMEALVINPGVHSRDCAAKFWNNYSRML